MTKDVFIAALRSNNAITFQEATSEQERTIENDWIAEAVEARLPVRLLRAKIRGPLVLDSQRVAANFELIGCELELFTANYSSFDKWVRFERCLFSSHCSLKGAVFHSAVRLSGSQFHGHLDFSYSTVTVDLDLDDVHCAKRVDLLGSSVGKNFHCRNATFDGEFLMALAQVSGQFDIRKTSFLSGVKLVDAHLGGLVGLESRFTPTTNEDVLFDRMTVDSAINFAEAHFATDVSFSGIAVRGQLIFEGAIFGGDFLLEGASANDGFFRSVVFGANTSLVGSSLFSADLSDSTFSGMARFNDLRIEVALSLNGTLFSSNARFDRLRVGQALRIAATNVRRPAFKGEITSFAGSKIGSQGSFEDIAFDGSAIFEGAEFGADVYIGRCSVGNIASFFAAKCHGNASFVGDQFSQSDWNAVQAGGNIGFSDCKFLKAADFGYVTSNGNLVFSDCEFTGELLLKNAEVRGEISFQKTAIQGALSLEMATCGTLHFFGSLTPSARIKVPDLSKIPINAIGLRYKQIYCVWIDFVQGLIASRLYSFDPFAELESALRRAGMYHWADEVYLRGRKNLRNSFPRTSLRYWWDVALEGLSGYGLRPGRTLLALLALLALTTILIANIHGFASPIASAACQRGTNARPDLEIAANLAIRQFVIGAGEAVGGWKISECPLAGAWVRPYTIIGILRLLGLILIPFVIASVSGVLKYIGRR